MSSQYISEIFYPSYYRYNTRMITLKLDLPLQHCCLGQKTISYLGPKTWNNLPAKIKLSRNVNTFKHDIRKLFFDELEKQNDDIFFYYQIKIPTQPFFNFLLHVLFFICLYQYSPFVSLYSPRDHNENKVYLDLYYAIGPATV